MEIKEIIEDHEKRIKLLEDKLMELIQKPELLSKGDFIFSDKSKKHNELLEELLKSELCHSKNGLSFEEILEIFSSNNRPVMPKKLQNLLAIWKNRKKIEAIKCGGILKYFWIENGK